MIIFKKNLISSTEKFVILILMSAINGCVSLCERLRFEDFLCKVQSKTSPGTKRLEYHLPRQRRIEECS